MKNKTAIIVSSAIFALGAVFVLAAGSGSVSSWLIDGDKMYATSTVNFVGIGTTDPQQLLDVQGRAIIKTWLAGDDTNGYLKLYGDPSASNSVDIQDDGDLYITSGTLGIGMAPSPTNVRAMIKAVNNPGGSIMIRGIQATTNEASFDLWHPQGNPDAVLSLYDDAEGENVRLHAGGNSWFNSGNVGIGTTTPSSILNIVKGGATTTVTVGGGNSPACLKLMDSDNSGWTYCRFLDGAMNCSTVSCE